ncbi:MAG: phosphatidate cytidylyltransferase [Balneolaceae bacterium]|nr:phosphatidate cytidylyltransferase [Balneolaceae bacterium]
MSELATRIATALPAAALLLFAVWMGGWILFGAAALLALLGVRELHRICSMAGWQGDPVLAALLALWLLSAPINPHMMATGFALMLLLVIRDLMRGRPADLDRLVATPFVAFYPSAGLLALLLIRDTAAGDTGFALVVTLLLMVWGNDVFAYFGGKAFGRRPMAPRISPRKTWEGFGSGLLGAVTGVMLSWWLLPGLDALSWQFLLPAAVLVSLFGPAGDLTVSRLKRAAGVKDSSGLLPGHGGVLDRLDALLLAAPVFWLYLHLALEAGYAAI